MGIEQSAAFGGRGEQTPEAPQPILGPAEQADIALAKTLAEAAPEGVKILPELARLGVIDIDDGKGAVHPLRVPLLGHGSLLLGEGPPRRLAPTVTRGVPHTQMRRAIAASKIEDELDAQRRKASFIADGFKAAEISTALIAEAAMTLPRGNLVVRVCDMLGGGKAFAGLEALNEPSLKPRYQYIQPEDLSATEDASLPLKDLQETLETMQELVKTRREAFGNDTSMFEAVAKTGKLDRTWQIVVVIGNGKSLPYYVEAPLAKLMKDGPAAGVSCIVFGVDFDTSETLTRITQLRHPQVRVSSLPGVEVTLNTPPTADELRHIAGHMQPATTNKVPVTAAAYSRAVTKGLHERQLARAETHQLGQKFPLLKRANLERVIRPSVPQYAKAVREIARSADPFAAAKEAFDRVRADKTKMSPQQRDAQMAMALAGLDLAVSAGYGHGWLSETMLGRSIDKNLFSYLIHLPSLVTITRQHGLDRLPPRTRAYVGQYLGDSPPAWALQVVSRHGRTNKPARKAVESHLQYTFDPQQEFGLNLQDDTLYEALLELDIARALGAGDPETPAELLAMIDRRLAPKLNKITRSQLPRTAHQIYGEFQVRAHEERSRQRNQIAPGVGSVAGGGIYRPQG